MTNDNMRRPRRHFAKFAPKFAHGSVRALMLCSALALLAPVPLGAQSTSPRRPAAAAANVSVDHGAWLYAGSDIPPDPGWQFGTLNNGLRFAVRRNGVPPGQVTIRLRVDAGSLMERPEEAGWAHLIEHLAFRESRYLPSGEARRAWQRLGVAFGSDSNAHTGQTETVYQLDIPSATPEAVAECIRLLSGMIRDPVLTDATVDAERPIVIAERREREGPDFRVDEAARSHIFRGQLMGDHATIGSEATLNGANGAGIAAFHQRWYRPERVVIAVAGDLDPAIFERAIVANFADWQGSGPRPAEPDLGVPATDGPVSRIIVEPGQPLTVQQLVLRPWHRVTDSIAYTQGLMLDSLATIIINRQLEERARGGARYLSAQVSTDKPSRSADLTALSVVPLDNDWEGALTDARTVVATLGASAVDQAAITREFSNVETFLARENANRQNEPATKQADDLLHAVDIGETTTSPDHALAIWQSIAPLATPGEMQRRIRALFVGTATRALMVSPTAVADGEARLAAAVNRNVAVRNAANDNGRVIRFADLPSPGAPGRLVSRTPSPWADLERWEFANGVTALVRNTNIEPNKVRIRVRWGAGRRALAPDQPNLLWAGESALVESGIGRFDISQLDQLSDGRQIGMSFAVDDDAFELSAETQPSDLADQLKLLAAKLVAPGWQANPVLRARAGRLAGFDLLRNSPNAVLENQLDSLVYSGDRRWAPPTRAEVEGLTPAAFRRFWEPLLRQGPIEVQIFGDVGNVDLETMLRTSFGAMAARPPAVPSAADGDVHFASAGTEPIIARHSGAASQAAYVLAYPTGGGIANARLSRQLDVLAAIFNDRLYDRLRDHSGASYSQAVVSRWSDRLMHGSYILVGGMTRPEDSALVASSARAIAAELATTPVSADELQRAVEPIVEQLLRASSGNVFWMRETEGASRDPRIFLSLRSYLNDLRSVTAADVQALARRFLGGQSAVSLIILPDGSPVPSLDMVATAAPANGAVSR